MAITKQMNIKNRTYYFYNGFIEEKRGNKHLNIAFTDNNEEVLKNIKKS